MNDDCEGLSSNFDALLNKIRDVLEIAMHFDILSGEQCEMETQTATTRNVVEKKTVL